MIATDLLAPLVTAIAGLLAGVFSWRTASRARELEVRLRFREQEVAIDPQGLAPKVVETRLRALAKIAPDAAVVDAWRTLEALANRHRSAKGASSAMYGKQLRDYFLHEGIVDVTQQPLLDSLLQARNAALHVTEKSTDAPTVDEYLPLVRRVAAATTAQSA